MISPENLIENAANPKIDTYVDQAVASRFPNAKDRPDPAVVEEFKTFLQEDAKLWEVLKRDGKLAIKDKLGPASMAEFQEAIGKLDQHTEALVEFLSDPDHAGMSEVIRELVKKHPDVAPVFKSKDLEHFLEEEDRSQFALSAEQKTSLAPILEGRPNAAEHIFGHIIHRTRHEPLENQQPAIINQNAAAAQDAAKPSQPFVIPNPAPAVPNNAAPAF